MSYLTDWEFYSSLFPSSKISEDRFNALIPQAQAKLETWTSRRILTEAMAYKVTQIERTLCYMVNALDKQSNVGVDVKSISNDGYSESYLSKSEAENELKGIALGGLSGTGLMGAL